MKPHEAVSRLIAASTLLAMTAAAQDRFDSSPSTPARPAPAVTPAAPAYTPPTGSPTAPAKSNLQRPPSPPTQVAAGNEGQDYGVAAPAQLHSGPMHGPTPTSIPGAQSITTAALVQLLKGNASRVLVFDVLGSAERMPGALNAVPAHQAGSFDDTVQRDFGNFLQQVTQGRKDVPLVFYCQSTMCWMSYNAALRASRLGYRQVLWYRGGLEAWKASGQALQGTGSTNGGSANRAP